MAVVGTPTNVHVAVSTDKSMADGIVPPPAAAPAHGKDQLLPPTATPRARAVAAEALDADAGNAHTPPTNATGSMAPAVRTSHAVEGNGAAAPGLNAPPLARVPEASSAAASSGAHGCASAPAAPPARPPAATKARGPESARTALLATESTTRKSSAPTSAASERSRFAVLVGVTDGVGLDDAVIEDVGEALTVVVVLGVSDAVAVVLAVKDAVAVVLAVKDAVGLAVRVSVLVKELVALLVGVPDVDGVAVIDAVGVTVREDVPVNDGVPEPEFDAVGVTVLDGVGDAVSEGVGDAEGVCVGDALVVAVPVWEGVKDGVAVRVVVDEGVGVAVTVSVDMALAVFVALPRALREALTDAVLLKLPRALREGLTDAVPVALPDGHMDELAESDAARDSVEPADALAGAVEDEDAVAVADGGAVEVESADTELLDDNDGLLDALLTIEALGGALRDSSADALAEAVTDSVADGRGDALLEAEVVCATLNEPLGDAEGLPDPLEPKDVLADDVAERERLEDADDEGDEKEERDPEIEREAFPELVAQEDTDAQGDADCVVVAERVVSGERLGDIVPDARGDTLLLARNELEGDGESVPAALRAALVDADGEPLAFEESDALVTELGDDEAVTRRTDALESSEDVANPEAEAATDEVAARVRRDDVDTVADAPADAVVAAEPDAWADADTLPLAPRVAVSEVTLDSVALSELTAVVVPVTERLESVDWDGSTDSDSTGDNDALGDALTQTLAREEAEPELLSSDVVLSAPETETVAHIDRDGEADEHCETVGDALEDADLPDVALPHADTVDDALGGEEARAEGVPAPDTVGAELRDGLPDVLAVLVARTDALDVALAHLDDSALGEPAPGERDAPGEAETDGDDDWERDTAALLDTVEDVDIVRDTLGERDMRGERLGEALPETLTVSDGDTVLVSGEDCDELGDMVAERERVGESDARADLDGEPDAQGVAVEQGDARADFDEATVALAAAEALGDAVTILTVARAEEEGEPEADTLPEGLRVGRDEAEEERDTDGEELAVRECATERLLDTDIDTAADVDPEPERDARRESVGDTLGDDELEGVGSREMEIVVPLLREGDRDSVEVAVGEPERLEVTVPRRVAEEVPLGDLETAALAETVEHALLTGDAETRAVLVPSCDTLGVPHDVGLAEADDARVALTHALSDGELLAKGEAVEQRVGVVAPLGDERRLRLAESDVNALGELLDVAAALFDAMVSVALPERDTAGLRDVLLEPLGERLALSLEKPVRDGPPERDALAHPETVAYEGVALADAAPVVERVPRGVRLADGEMLLDADADGDRDGRGDTLTEGLVDAHALAEAGGDELNEDDGVAESVTTDEDVREPVLHDVAVKEPEPHDDNVGEMDGDDDGDLALDSEAGADSGTLGVCDTEPLADKLSSGDADMPELLEKLAELVLDTEIGADRESVGMLGKAV